MLAAANLNFVAFWRFGPQPQPPVGVMVAIFSIAIAAAEAAVGLALVIAIYRHYRSTNVDKFDLLKARTCRKHRTPNTERRTSNSETPPHSALGVRCSVFSVFPTSSNEFRDRHQYLADSSGATGVSLLILFLLKSRRGCRPGNYRSHVAFGFASWRFWRRCPRVSGPFQIFTWFTSGDQVLRLGWMLDPLAAAMLITTLVGLRIFVFSIGSWRTTRTSPASSLISRFFPCISEWWSQTLPADFPEK